MLAEQTRRAVDSSHTADQVDLNDLLILGEITGTGFIHPGHTGIGNHTVQPPQQGLRLLQCREDVLGVADIQGHAVNGHISVAFGNVFSQRLQHVKTPGHQNQVDATTGKLIGQRFTDTG